jgi:hypothetical protein
VNDAVRQVGGALGVAVLGSLLSSAYSSALPPVVRGVPVPEQARDGLGGSLAVAGHLPAEAGRELMNAAGRAYVHAMDRGVLVGAGVALAGALVALVWMPAKGRAPEVEDASAAVRKEVVAVPAGC